MYVRTGIGPGVKNVVQHSIVVHIKPVSHVSQSVWTTGTRQVRVKDNVKQKKKTSSNTHLQSLYGHIMTSSEEMSHKHMVLNVKLRSKHQMLYSCSSLWGYKVFSVSMKMIFPPEYPSSPGSWAVTGQKQHRICFIHVIWLFDSFVLSKHFGAAIFKRLLTHHRVCETAGFSLCGTL